MVIVVTSMSDNEKPILDSNTNIKIRRRLQELDEFEKLKRESSAGWIYTFWIGLSILIIGIAVFLYGLGIIPVNYPVIGALVLIIFGLFIIVTSLFMRKTTDLYIDEYRRK